VEAAHQKMVATARGLQESGEIQLQIGVPEEVQEESDV
jgi:flagellar motor switch protein FliG